MGDFKLDNFDTFTRAIDNLYVTMEACNVWLLWYHAWRDVWLLWYHAWRDVWIPWKHKALQMINKEPYLARHRN